MNDERIWKIVLWMCVLCLVCSFIWTFFFYRGFDLTATVISLVVGAIVLGICIGAYHIRQRILKRYRHRHVHNDKNTNTQEDKS